MFDIGWPELFLIGTVMLIVVGPKDLPGAVRTVVQTMSKVRGAARDFQRTMMDAAHEADLAGLQREVQEGLDVKRTLKEAIDEDSMRRELQSLERTVQDDGAQEGKPASEAKQVEHTPDSGADSAGSDPSGRVRRS